MTRSAILLLAGCLLLAACSPQPQSVAFQATLPVLDVTAPVYTVTPTRTHTLTHTPTPLPTDTPLPSATPTETPVDTSTPLPTPMPTETLTPTRAPTVGLLTLTPPLPIGAPANYEPDDAPLSAVTGWSCGDFPCENDISGFLRRIRVPEGFTVEYAGRFPGQVQQIVYGPDGRLYATVLENGTRNGAVYALDDSDPSNEPVRYSRDIISPIGLAFQPGSDTLFVSGRVTAEQGGGIWSVSPDGDLDPLVTNLPCCFNAVDNQPNGLIFGRDGYLYVGVGSLTDTTLNPPRSSPAYATLVPNEASVLRVQPMTGLVESYATGIRNPFDLAIDSIGRLYATDNGILEGPGDRLLRLEAGANYGFPYWRDRGCEDCPIRPGSATIPPDLYSFPPYTLPRGAVVYTGTQFPVNMFDTVFVALWNAVDGGQRIVWIDPARVNQDNYTPQAFVTGLIRPVDVVVAPDGSLVIADYVYGHIWRVRYTP